MAAVGLKPEDSKLALPGCKTARLAYCDGAEHDCSIMVDEAGAMVVKAETLVTPPNVNIKPLVTGPLVAGHSLMS